MSRDVKSRATGKCRYVIVVMFSLSLACCANPLGSSSQVSTNFHPGLLAPPHLLALSPTSGAITGGTLLTLSGDGFAKNATVTVGGNNCGSVLFISARQIQCLTVGHVAATVDVTITNIDRQSSTLADSYTFGLSATSVPGFSATSGGGFLSSTAYQLHGTVGTIGSTPVQTGTGMRLVGGIIGIQRVD